MATGRMSVLVIAGALAGCWSAPAAGPAPRASGDKGPVAGTRWTTPAPPWRASERVHAIVVLGDKVLLGGKHGWLSELDLGSGELVRERSIGAVWITDLLRLASGKLLAVGMEDEHAAAYLVDERTLTAEKLELTGQKRSYAYQGVSARSVPGHGVLLAGAGLPLAIYDPTSWKPRVVLSAELDWREPFVTSDAIHARRGVRDVKFPLARGEGVASPRILAAAGGSVIREDASRGSQPVLEVAGNPTPVPLPAFERSLVIDLAGRRVISAFGRHVNVRSLADGSLVRQIELDARIGYGAKLVVDGDRLLVADGVLVRRIDLVSGTATPRGALPAGLVEAQLVVGDDGRILVLGDAAITIAGGAVTRSIELDGQAFVNPPGELARHAIAEIAESSPEGGETITRFAPGGHRKRWQVDRSVAGGWLGAGGEIAVVLDADEHRGAALMRSDGDRLVEVLAFDMLASIDDVDLEAGLAALTHEGTTHLVDLGAGALTELRLRAPGCDESGRALLERRGARAVTLSRRALILWERKGATALGSLALDADVVAATFVPGTDDLLVHLVDGLVVWSPEARAVRTARLPHLSAVGVSPNGKHLALAFASGQVVSVDYATMRAGLPAGKARALSEVPAYCEEADPLGDGDADLSAEHDDHDDHDHDDHDDHDDAGELDDIDDLTEEERAEMVRDALGGAGAP